MACKPLTLKIYIYILIVLMVLSMTACTENKEETLPATEPVSTTTPVQTLPAQEKITDEESALNVAIELVSMWDIFYNTGTCCVSTQGSGDPSEFAPDKADTWKSYREISCCLSAEDASAHRNLYIEQALADEYSFDDKLFLADGVLCVGMEQDWVTFDIATGLSVTSFSEEAVSVESKALFVGAEPKDCTFDIVYSQGRYRISQVDIQE